MILGITASQANTPAAGGTEIYGQDNAASRTVDIEAVTGWTEATGLSSLTTDGDSYNGTWSIKAVADAATGLMRYSFSATTGKTYAVTIWAKCGETPNSQRFTLWQNINETINTDIDNETWTEYTFNVTPVTTGLIQMRVYAGRTVGNVGDSVLVDYISIIETDA